MNNREHTVFVVQNPDGKEILPAGKFGRLHVILTGKEHPTMAFRKLREHMIAFKDTDFLLPIGSPLNIGLAMRVAFEKSSTINVLVWDRQSYNYNVERITDECITKSAHATANIGQ